MALTITTMIESLSLVIFVCAIADDGRAHRNFLNNNDIEDFLRQKNFSINNKFSGFESSNKTKQIIVREGEQVKITCETSGIGLFSTQNQDSLKLIRNEACGKSWGIFIASYSPSSGVEIYYNDLPPRRNWSVFYYEAGQGAPSARLVLTIAKAAYEDAGVYRCEVGKDPPFHSKYTVLDVSKDLVVKSDNGVLRVTCEPKPRSFLAVVEERAVMLAVGRYLDNSDNKKLLVIYFPDLERHENFGDSRIKVTYTKPHAERLAALTLTVENASCADLSTTYSCEIFYSCPNKFRQVRLATIQQKMKAGEFPICRSAIDIGMIRSAAVPAKSSGNVSAFLFVAIFLVSLVGIVGIAAMRSSQVEQGKYMYIQKYRIPDLD